jgi:hypothetical protein
LAQLRRWQSKLQATHPDARNRDIFSYPVFRFSAGGKRKHITGRVRHLLNDRQKPRWDFFFRPNMSLLAAVDEERFGLLKAEIVRATAERNSLEELPKIFEKLETAKGHDTLLVGVAIICAVCAVLLFALSSTWWWAAVPLALGTAGALMVRPRDRIQTLEQTKQKMSFGIGEPVNSTFDIRFRRQQVIDHISLLTEQFDAIQRFRDDIWRQRPTLVLNDKDMDFFLNEALDDLERRERQRLNIYDEDESVKFGPIIRWALETDRKQALDALRPPVYSVARRGSLYARYYVQIIFVCRGQLTLYQGFYDLIQGEWMGEARTHIILANLFSVYDETTADFDFRRRLEDAISLSYGAHSGVEMNPEDVEDDTLVASGSEESQEEEDPDLVSVIQTTIVRFIGSGQPVELKFVVSGYREGLITQLQKRREIEETVIASLEQQVGQDSESATELRAHEERLLRIREDEERVRRSTTTHNVEPIVNQILEHTRRAVGHRRTETGIN